MPYYDLAEIIYQWHGSTYLLCSPSTAQRKKKKVLVFAVLQNFIISDTS